MAKAQISTSLYRLMRTMLGVVQGAAAERHARARRKIGNGLVESALCFSKKYLKGAIVWMADYECVA